MTDMWIGMGPMMTLGPVAMALLQTKLTWLSAHLS